MLAAFDLKKQLDIPNIEVRVLLLRQPSITFWGPCHT